MLFDGWDSLLRTLIVGVLGYVAIIVLLRISGTRTLSKMYAFDLVVTIALGSILASLLLFENVSLAHGVFAFALLIGLQYAVSWSGVRARWVRRLVKGEPLMLLYCGEFLPVALRQARLTEDDVRAAIRSAGVYSLDEVRAIVLETDGSLSIVRPGESENENGSSLVGIDVPKGFREPAER